MKTNAFAQRPKIMAGMSGTERIDPPKPETLKP
jgi:hypothetical protein